MTNERCIIACPIFKDELNAVLPSGMEGRIHFMDRRIHNDAKCMYQELQKAASSLTHCDISILVGHDCYSDISISDFAKSINARLPAEKNCIEAILGAEKTETLQRNRTTIHTRGWMEMISQSAADDPITKDSIRIELGHFDRILLVDYGIKPFSDEEILTYYDLVQVPIDVQTVQLNYFETVIGKLLA